LPIYSLIYNMNDIQTPHTRQYDLYLDLLIISIGFISTRHTQQYDLYLDLLIISIGFISTRHTQHTRHIELIYNKYTFNVFIYIVFYMPSMPSILSMPSMLSMPS